MLSGTGTDALAALVDTKSQEAPIVIDEQGGLLLLVYYSNGLTRRYRVAIPVLRTHSSYFDRLLDSTKFSEGIAVESRLADLRKRYPHIASVSYDELPVVTLSDVHVKSSLSSSLFESAFEFFLRILHGKPEWPNRRKATAGQSTFLAVLTHFADMFAAVPFVSSYIKPQTLNGLLHGDMRPPIEISEDKSRRKLYVGLVMGLPQWVRFYSAALIIQGSRRWLEEDGNSETVEPNELPWDNLPGGVEDTISSLQTHFFNLYVSREPQCKLGYDSSPKCDDFQLGSMVRFLTRKGMLSLQSTFVGTPEAAEPFTGDITELLKALKECPNYQIDANHRHCGLRARIIPRLDAIDPWFQVGICLSCWRNARSTESWIEDMNQGRWQYGPAQSIDPPSALPNSCKTASDHIRFAKSMYTAAERNWTPSVV
ncbi:MAG: hypothetical protein Q9218_006655 [Villophora microphyllina]